MAQQGVATNLTLPDFGGDPPFAEALAELGVAYGPAWPDRFGAFLRRHAAEEVGQTVSTLSLFSGGGGLDLGFHDWAFAIQEAVEIEPKYARTLEANASQDRHLAGTTVVCADICDYEPSHRVRPELVIGGPPCQTFSAAGRRASGVAGTDDARGALFWQYVRLLEALKPAGFLFENVYGIMGAQGGEPWRQIRSAFSEAGYSLSFRILDAADYGVPQHRERLFIVGLREGSFRFPEPTHGPDAAGGQPHFSAGEAISLVDAATVPAGIGGRYGELLEDIPAGLNYSFYTEKLGHPRPVFAWRSKFSDFLYKADPARPIRTLKAKGGQYTGPFHWDNRVFTLPELKRLQTFPDDYEVIGGRGAAIEQLGNSVPPQLARILALSIGEQVFGVRSPIPLRYMSHDRKLGFRQRKRQLTQVYAKKARAAHAGTGPGAARDRKARDRSTRIRTIDKTFGWGEALPDATPVRCSLDLSAAAWRLRVALQGEPARVAPGISIVVTPTNASWALPTEKVVLSTAQLTPATFTAAWKLFDEVTAQETGVADLVQLAGYYQYAPALRSTMDGEGDLPPRWLPVRGVVQGALVATTARLSQFREAWGLGDEKEALATMRFLRTLGFEVRSHRTNPQIPHGSFLVPYAFPTLTPQSVQLHKRL